MKLGITQLLPRTLAEIDAAAIRSVRELGFTGTALSIDDDPAGISTDQARELGKRFAAEGIELVEYGHYQTSFVDPDDAVVALSLARVTEACRVAAAVGCPTIVVGIGSLNPAGQWFPYGANFEPAAVARLTSSLKLAAKIGEVAGVIVALECHVATTLRNAAVAREVLDAVGSPWVKVHLDVVNWMASLDDAYDSGPAIRRQFEALGPAHISGAHSKGVMVQNQLIVHMDETYTGSDDDLLDHSSLLQVMATMPGSTYVVIEHLTVAQMPTARDRLLTVAHEQGLRFAGQPS